LNQKQASKDEWLLNVLLGRTNDMLQERHLIHTRLEVLEKKLEGDDMRINELMDKKRDMRINELMDKKRKEIKLRK